MTTTSRRFTIQLDGHSHEVRLAPDGAAGNRELELEVEIDGHSRRERVRVLAAGVSPLLLVGGRVVKWAALAGRHERVLSRGGTVKTARVGSARELTTEQGVEGGGLVRAPMPGRIVDVAVSPGQDVTTGALLVVIEAMKMQNEILAPGPGRVGAVLVRPGDAVERGAELVRIG